MHDALNQGQSSTWISAVKRGVIVVCLVASAIAGANIFHWYRIQQIEPAYTRQIPHIKWSHPLDPLYPVWSAPFLGKDGTLYIPATEAVHAVDPSGTMRWEYRVGADDPIMRNGFFQDDAGNIYVATMKYVYSLTAEGVKRWQAGCASGALAHTEQGWPSDANVLYTTCDTHFAALYKNNGSESWALPVFETQDPHILAAAPLMLSSGTLIFDKDQHIYATDRSGKTLWTYPGDIDAARLVGTGPGDTVYAVDLAKGLTALDASTGSVKWTFQGEPRVGFESAPVTAPDGTIYVVAARGPLFAFFDDGSLKWTFPLPDKIAAPDGYASPLLGSDGTIYLLLDHSVIAVSPAGKIIWQQDLPGPKIPKGFLTLASDGTLYVVTDAAMIHAVQTASRGPARSSGGGF